MHNVLKNIYRLLSTLSLLVITLTACMPDIASTPEEPPPTPSITSPTRTALPPSPSPLPPTPTLTSTPTDPLIIDSIQMIDKKMGWALGQIGTEGLGRLLRTTDGGATWQDVSPGTRSHYGLAASDAQHAWIRSSDNDAIWRTQDGGKSWTSLGQIEGSEFWFNDSEHGWKMYAQAWGLSYVQFDVESFATTQDGGQTWQERELPPGWGLAFLAFPDSQTAWAVRAGFAKTIEGFPNLAVPFSLLTTFNGGRTWESQNMPLPPETDVVEMSDGPYLAAGNCDFDSPVYSSTAVWMMALTCEGGGWLYTSDDQGNAWTITPLPAGYVSEVQFMDPDMGWSLRKDSLYAHESDLYGTFDGGQTWSLLTHTKWADAQLNFVDEQTGWAVAVTCDEADCNPYSYPRALAKTTDGGQTWQILQPQVMP